MSQSNARRIRRECKRLGHLVKWDGESRKMCARCGESLEED